MKKFNDIQGEIDIKKYKKCKRLNKGGFGIIYKVEEKETKKTYAAKVIDCGDDEEQCNKMIEREVGIMMCAKHPTIINFIGFSKLDFQEENNITIIMELAKNGSLADVIRSIQKNDGPKDYTNTSRQIILIGVARGMKYLHDHNIIHRDLKTENVLLDEDFHPLITDFGMSKFFEDGHSYSQTQFGGTILYEAPEILKNVPYDRKVDVYAFGILMFEVVTDLFPYPELESREISDLDFRFKVANENYRPKFTIPLNENIKQLIEKCWSDNPKERPTFDEIYKELSNFDDHNFNQYLVDDVDIDEIKMYINDIIDPNEIQYNAIHPNESEIQQLKKENEMLKNLNEQNIKEINTYKEELQKLRNDNMKLKTENEQYAKKIKEFEEEINFLKTKKENENKLKSKTEDLQDKENKNTKENADDKESQSTKENKTEKENADNQVNKIVEENQKISENDQLTVFEFNNLPLRSQQSVSEDMSKTVSGKMSIFYNKISSITNYLLKLNQLTNSCIEITDETDERLDNMKEECRIQLCATATEILFDLKLFNSSDLLNIISEFSKFSFEVKYPSDSFKPIIDSILKIKKANANKNEITISLFITGIEEIACEIYNSKNISYIRIDDTVKRVKNYKESYSTKSPFQGCTSLIEIKIPPSLSSFGYDAFRSCTSLKKITIPSSVTEMKWGFFRECSSIEQITIPSSVTRIGDHAFDECTSLKQVSIPSSVTSIGDKVFCDCSSLEKISIPSIHSLGRLIFFRCPSLTEITIPSSVTSIGECAFNRCTKLTKVTIPSSVSTIYEYAFYSCSSLEQVSLPIYVSIYGGVFAKCFKLSEITIRNDESNIMKKYKKPNIDLHQNKFLVCKSNFNNESFDVLLFVKDCKEIVNIPSFISQIGSSTFAGCTSLKQIIIPSSVTKIGKYAFTECSLLEKIALPSSLTQIEVGVFKECSSLEEISIPSSVTSIEESAFENCTSLKQVLIPSSVTVIGSRSFQNCSSLKELTIPSSVIEIGCDSFNNCTSLIKISVPESIKTIKSAAFTGCTSLKQISIPSSLIKIESSTFKGCSSLTEITIPSSVTEIEFSTFSECSSLVNVSIPSSVIKIGSSIFWKCSSLTHISIPSSVTEIGYSSFSYCPIEEILIHSSVKKIGNSAFFKCSSLKKVIFETPSSLEEFEQTLFKGCSSLNEILLPSSLTKVGVAVFEDCTSLVKITIPSSVTSIGNYAFRRCSSLAQITISSSMTSFGAGIFSDCTSLEQITIPSSLNIKGIWLPPKIKIEKL